VIDDVIRDIQGGIPWCMAFADDVVLVDESVIPGFYAKTEYSLYA
jgi:hypothetical protein